MVHDPIQHTQHPHLMDSILPASQRTKHTDKTSFSLGFCVCLKDSTVKSTCIIDRETVIDSNRFGTVHLLVSVCSICSPIYLGTWGRGEV